MTSLVGRSFPVEVTGWGHGGFGVARLDEEAGEAAGTVVFVRHSLPGERVTVEVTEGEVGDRFLRGDAVAVARPHPDRVAPPCPLAGPGRCGGCDLQHATLAAQRRLKAEVVVEQLRRIAGLEREVEVEALPGDGPGDDDPGLHWRTRMRYHRLPDGGLGLRAVRSERVVPVPRCLVQAPEAVVVVDGEEPDPPVVSEHVGDHRFEVAADGFWQVHRAAPETLVDTVTAYAAARPGERVLDLFSGVGLFSAFLAEAVGPQGRVDAVEGDRRAAEHARANLAAYPWARVHRGDVARVLRRGSPGGRVPDSCDLAVLDPPRAGARRAVVAEVAKRRPSRVVLVSCDPAAFARDVALLGEEGLALTRMRALDLFPMTSHVECVALLVKCR